MNGTADPAPSSADLVRLTAAVLAAEPVTVSADAEHGDVEHEARLIAADDWRALCALLRSLDDHPAPLCSCGKPATHLDAPEDSDDWACLVRDPSEYTPPSWLHDERPPGLRSAL